MREITEIDVTEDEQQDRENALIDTNGSQKDSISPAGIFEVTAKTFDTSEVPDITFDFDVPDINFDTEAPDFAFDIETPDITFDVETPDINFDAGAPDINFDTEDPEPRQLPHEPPSNSDDAALQTLSPLDAKEATIHRSFKPISPAKLKKARRTRRTLITVIVLLLLLLCAGIAAGVYYYLNYVQGETTHTYDPVAIEHDSNTIDDRGVTEAVEMPNLAQMFGLTPEEVLSILGADYTITKTDSDVANQAPSGTANEADSGDYEAEATTKQVVTISYTPQEQNSTVNLRQSQKIYLSLGEQGTTIEVYFVSSMDILDFPFSSFSDLVSTNNYFVWTLSQAGVFALQNVPYKVPSREEYTEFVDKDANVLKIQKETTTWTGTLASGVPPTSFEIRFTYDYGASGVEDSPDKHPLQRMVYLKLR